MRLAHVGEDGRGGTDRLIAEAAARLAAAGLRLAGTVQTDLPRADRPRCDMDLTVLPTGPVLRISEDRGAAARGCRLDHAALEEAVAVTAIRLETADLLIVNKFGRLETLGRGFVPLIGSALERGLPVLVGVNARNLPEYQDFVGGLSQPLPADPAAILAWALESR